MSEVNTDAGNVRLVGGRVCLDFVNTVDSFANTPPKDYLRDYAALLRWSQHAGVISGAEHDTLAASTDVRAGAVVDIGRALRLALYQIFTLPAGRPEHTTALAHLNAAYARTPARTHLYAAAGGYEWGWQPASDVLALPLWRVVWSAVDLLPLPEARLVRECAAPGCSWLFLDTSTTGRRWCSMEDCGNRAKARRHYQRRGMRA